MNIHQLSVAAFIFIVVIVDDLFAWNVWESRIFWFSTLCLDVCLPNSNKLTMGTNAVCCIKQRKIVEGIGINKEKYKCRERERAVD